MSTIEIGVIPKNGWIFVQRDPAAEKIGSIHVPGTAQKHSEVATIKFGDSNEFYPGDRVILGKFSGQEYSFNKESYWRIRADEVIATIDPEAPPESEWGGVH